jgi:lysophospholipase L1-like esterase
MPRKSMRARLILLGGAAVLALPIAELLLRAFAPVSDPFARYKAEDRAGNYIPSAHTPNYQMTVTAEPGLPGVSGTATFSTNNVGFRGEALARPKPPREYRIFLVGGSTTECHVLDDTQALHAALQQRLRAQVGPGGPRVVVYNAGKAGDKSTDHVAVVTQRLVHLEPDLVVVFAGINDLRAAVHRFDYLHLAESSQAKYTLPLLVKFAATEFQIPRRLWAIQHGFRLQGERERLEAITTTTDCRLKADLAASKPFSDLAPHTDLPPYRRHLQTLAGAARAHGFALVFMTQATTWNSQVDPEARRWHWLGYLDGVRYREDALHRALESYNDVMREVAAEADAPLLDLAVRLPKSLEYFYDDVHFNVRGAATAAAALADILAARGLPPAQP